MTLPSNLPTILRSHGLKVVEIDGWRTRGRPASTGGFAPVGVLNHHDASSANGMAAIPLLVRGRSDLPGPLAQLSVDRQGVVYIIAAGRANHAGKARASGTVAAGDGNVLYIGIEAQNRGTGEPWPKAQYDALVLLNAVLSVEVTGNSAQTCRGHKETSVTGKIDPAGPTPYERTFDMDKFRGRIAAKIDAIRHPAPVVNPRKALPTHELTVWQVNTHRGQCLKPGRIEQFRAQVHHFDPDIVTGCEVTDPADVERLRTAFERDYVMIPDTRHAKGKWASQTPILLRRSRFSHIIQANPLTSPWLGGGRFGQLWPTRYGTRARAFDKVTRRWVIVQSQHRWVESRGAKVVVGLARQMGDLTASIRKRGRDRVVIVAGDWNQNLNVESASPLDVRNILGKLRMVNASKALHHPPNSTSLGHKSRLDDLFYRTGPFIRPRTQEIHDIAGGSDHRGVLTVLTVTEKESA